jgi:hypothetical protein
MTAGALGGSYYFTSRTSNWVALLFVGNFIAIWLAQLFLYAIWSMILWPKLFSPLRGLPEPGNNSFLMGQYLRIAAEPTGAPMLDW